MLYEAAVRANKVLALSLFVPGLSGPVNMDNRPSPELARVLAGHLPPAPRPLRVARPSSRDALQTSASSAAGLSRVSAVFRSSPKWPTPLHTPLP